MLARSPSQKANSSLILANLRQPFPSSEKKKDDWRQNEISKSKPSRMFKIRPNVQRFSNLREENERNATSNNYGR